MNEEKMLCAWDQSEIIENQVKFLIEEHDDFKNKTPEEVRESVYQDHDLFQIEWESLTDYLTELMNERNSDGLDWKCSVSKFGWRGLDGYKIFSAETGGDRKSVV